MIIPDELLAEAGLTEDELLVEVACVLFDAGKLTFFAAAKLARRTRSELEAELMRRNIPIHRPTVDDLEADLTALRKLDQ